MSEEIRVELKDEELDMVIGGKNSDLKTYICQACGKSFKDKKNKKWKGEPTCPDCR